MTIVPDPLGARGSVPIPMVPPPAEVWEYRHVERNVRTEDAPSEEDLNAFGRDGWEMIGIYFDSPLLHMYFKRPV